MYASARILTILFSVCFHGSLAGLAYLLSGPAAPVQEKVYQVSLAEFAAPAATSASPAQQDAPPQPEATPPPPPPKPEPAKPEPVKELPKEPEKKVISPKKRTDAPKPKEKAKPETPAAASPAAQPSQTPSAAARGPRQVGGLSAYDQDMLDQRPNVAKRVQPDYPSKARRMNMQGRVMVRLVVDTTGSPQSCTILSADPPGYFEEAALEAARKTRFIPGKIAGKAVNTIVHLPFAFALR